MVEIFWKKPKFQSKLFTETPKNWLEESKITFRLQKAADFPAYSEGELEPANGVNSIR